MMDNWLRLSELKVGQKACIQKIESEQIATVLFEMGFLPKEIITLENIAPLGDPILIHNSDYSLSIRKSEAQLIWVSLPTDETL